MNETTDSLLVRRSLAVSLLLVVIGFAVADALGDSATSGERAAEPPAEAAGTRALAEYLVAAAELRQGLLVHVNCGDGRLTAALGQAGHFIVHGLSPDPQQISRARQHIQDQKLYGRISVDRQSGARLPYVDNLVNMVVVDDLPAVLDRGLTVKEVVRVLCPGGVALLGRRGGAPASGLTTERLKSVLAEAGFEDADVLDGNGLWARVRKPWPASPGPDAPPSRVQWMAGPIWTRGHFSTLNWDSAGGRVFCFFDEAPTQVEGPPDIQLTARDAFNGRLLWKRPMPGTWQYPALQRATQKMLATDDRVYVVLEENGALVALDAATGKTLKTYTDESPNVILRHDKALILSGNRGICALDPETGKHLWESGFSGAIDIADGKVFCLTRDAAVCLDATSGEKLWQRNLEGGVRKSILRGYHAGVLLLAESRGSDAGAVHVLSAADGSHLWSKAYNCPPKGYGRDPLAAGGLIWLHVRDDKPAGTGWLGLDAKSGQERKRVDYPPEMAGGVRQRCFPNRVVGRFLVTGKDPVYVDWERGDVHVVKVARGTCRAGGGFHCDYGLVYTGPHQCHCFPMLRGFVALAPAAARPDDDAPRLEKGPAFDREPTADKTAADDWPCYRHDAVRSGATNAALPDDLKPLWRQRIGGQITSPVVAGGRLYVGSMDTHQVLAFDAARGTPVWTFTAGGPVDSPPAIYKGMCLFGSRDGWVYCLDASDGKLRWRSRGAPADQRILVDDRLESAWPVFGSVLIQNDTVFFTAGRDARLEGGLTLSALAPATGQLLWRKPLTGDLVADLLVSDGVSVCLPSLRFDPKTGQAAEVDPWRPTQLRGGRGGLLDGSLAIREGSWLSSVGGGRLLILDGRNDPQVTNDAGWSGPKADGVQVFSAERAYALSTEVTGDNYVKQGQGAWKLSARENRRGPSAWSVSVPIRPRAMLLAGPTILLAGTPDVDDREAPWAAARGEKGAIMWLIRAADGHKLNEMKFDAPPVWDGLAAAGDRLYVSLASGEVLCLGTQAAP